MKSNNRKGNVSVLTVVLVAIIVAILTAGIVYFIMSYTIKNDKTLEDKVNNDDYNASNEGEEVLIQDKEEKIDTASYNENYAKRILEIFNSGDSRCIFFNVMELEYNAENKIKLDSFSTIDYDVEKSDGAIGKLTYNITDTKYSEYESKLKEILTDDGINSLNSNLEFLKDKNVINIDGMAAVSKAGWSGKGYRFVSQELVSSEDGKFVYKVNYQAPKTMDMEEWYNKTMTLTGIIENGEYKIDKIEI